MPINATHRKRLARALAAQSGINYQQALDQVTAAADAGRLPRALDEAGMAAALRILTTPEAAAPQPGDALGLRPFEFRYVVYVSDGEIEWARNHQDAPTDEAALARIVADVAGYCAPLNPAVSAPGRVPLAGTDLVGYWETSAAEGPAPEQCWRFTLTGTVQAMFSDPGITGSNPQWGQSAQGVVEDGSWEGAAHGWDWSFASFLDIAEPGALPPAHRPQPEGDDSPAVEPGPQVTLDSLVAAPPATAPMFRMGGPYMTLVYNTQGQRVAPTCDVCGRHLAQGEPWWLVRQAGRSWASESGVCCADHNPQDLPPSPEDGSPVGMQTWDLVPNLLVQTKDNEILKVSTIYPNRVTAQVVYPLPPRTTVREYTPEQVATWREPSRAMLGKYERAWGFR